MSIEQTDVIDAVGQEPNGAFVLTISDHLEWDQDLEHLFLLQEKLNTYIRFLESGEVYETFPAAADRKFLLNVICQFRPNPQAMAFLNHARARIEEAGFSLQWGPLDGIYCDDSG